jgi:phosphatidyl-myo-inositol dimannoside synthase
MVARALADGAGTVLSLAEKGLDDLGLGEWATRAACAGSRLRAVATAFSWLRRFPSVHCLHLGLAPLVPIVAAAGANRFQWLMGVESWRPLRPWQRWPRPTAYLPISEYTWREFSRANPSAGRLPHEVIHLGWGALPLPEPGPGAPGRVLCCGRRDRPERRKGVEELLRAWPAVRSRRPDARLSIVGDGPDRARLEALVAELGLRDSVVFRGIVSETEKESELSRCQVFALPGQREGFGLVYVEAMRFGRPCLVGSDAGPEVARPGRESLSVDPRSPPAVAAGLIRLLEDEPLRRRLGDSGRRRAAAEFTEAHLAARLRRAMERLGETTP